MPAKSNKNGRFSLTNEFSLTFTNNLIVGSHSSQGILGKLKVGEKNNQETEFESMKKFNLESSKM